MNESGCAQEHHAAPIFRHHIMEGNWAKVEHTLSDLKPLLRHQKHIQVISLWNKPILFLRKKFLLHNGALSCKHFVGSGV